MKLRARFSLSFIGYTLLVLSGFGAAYYVFERQEARQAQRQEQIGTVMKVGSACEAMYLASSAIVAISYIHVIKKDPAVLFAACVDPRGLIQAHSDSGRIGRVLQDPGDLAMLRANGVESRTSRGDDGRPVVEWFGPVLVGGNRVGTAYAGYDPQVLEKEFRDRLWKILRRLIVVAGGTFLLAILIGVGLAWNLSRPIGGLVAAARAVGAGDFDYQTPIVRRGDELGYLAQEMNAMAQRLKSLDELKDEFISMVSHDLRGPMAAIKMYADYLLLQDADGQKLTPEHKRIVTTMMDSAMQLGVYVSNILDAAKLKAGKMEYHPEPVAPDAIGRSAEELYGIVAGHRGIEFALEFPSGLPPVFVDPVQFAQVLSNLVSNALKFTNSGGRIAVGATVAAPGFVDIYVSDTGQGIAPEDLPKLFRRFGQADVREQHSKGIQGTGLGLFMVKQTVEAMGGKVGVWSEPEKGTRITLRMPAASNGGKV